MRPISSIDPHYSQHPKRNSLTIEVPMVPGILTYFLPENNFMLDKTIIGMFTRRVGSNRKSKTGRALVADSVLNAAFLSLSNGNTTTLDAYPLENMAIDSSVHGPGHYDQIRLPEGTKFSASKIEIPAGVTLTADTVIELTFFYIFEDNC